ncbi:MAG: phytanoyl-CoA dioxygenase family protein [Proteobacteria bacterium]|nr:phytanoyl-CoA dioxygenase family protein [Pseudomonadota bacterium]
MAITPDQRSFYDENGYHLVRGLFEESETEVWIERFLAIVQEEVEPAPGMLVMRDVMVAKGAVVPDSRVAEIAKIQDFHADPVLFEGYMKHPRLLDVVESFTGPDMKSIHSMLINKPPGVDGRHPLHQDLVYFPFRPADSIVATWTALEPCTRENGCLVVVPGSHKGELRKHQNPDWEWLNLAYFGAEGADESTERVHLEMEVGDTVFFHPLLLHGSGRNRSSGFRRAISAHYASARCQFLPGAEPVGEYRPYLSVRGRTFEDGI